MARKHPRADIQHLISKKRGFARRETCRFGMKTNGLAAGKVSGEQIVKRRTAAVGKLNHACVGNSVCPVQ